MFMYVVLKVLTTSCTNSTLSDTQTNLKPLAYDYTSGKETNVGCATKLFVGPFRVTTQFKEFALIRGLSKRTKFGLWTSSTNLCLIKEKALSTASQKRTSSRETDLAVLSIWDHLRYFLKIKIIKFILSPTSRSVRRALNPKAKEESLI